MKTKMKRQGSTELPRFAVGALAIAGASAANAATVQITFAGSYISTTGGNQLVTDFGGDGMSDIIGGGVLGGVVLGDVWAYSVVARASGGFSSNVNGAFALVGTASGGRFGNRPTDAAAFSLRGLAAVRFSDANIRGGAQTNGWLDITAVASQPGEKRLTVNRLIFDDASPTAPTGLTSASTGIAEWSAPSGGATSAVPEASTSLGLLALGAGGLLTRRRQKRAA